MPVSNQLPGQVTPIPISTPDLVVKKVSVDGHVAPQQIVATIRNASGTDAGPSRTALILVTDQGARMLANKPTPAIPAGGEVAVTFSEQVAYGGYLIFLADAPSAQGAQGQVQEQIPPLGMMVLRREHNNVFAIPYVWSQATREFVNSTVN